MHQRAVNGEVLNHEADLFERENGDRIWIKWDLRPWSLGEEIGGVLMMTEDVTASVLEQEKIKSEIIQNSFMYNLKEVSRFQSKTTKEKLQNIVDFVYRNVGLSRPDFVCFFEFESIHLKISLQRGFKKFQHHSLKKFTILIQRVLGVESMIWLMVKVFMFIKR